MILKDCILHIAHCILYTDVSKRKQATAHVGHRNHGPPDGNPAIAVYSGVVQVLDGFWSRYFITVYLISSSSK